MSSRTWLGSNKQDWADYSLCEFSSMESLCQAAAWHLPAKAYAPDREIMARFLSVMENEHSMPWDEFWHLKIGDPDHEDLWEDYANTPTKSSIEVMEMLGSFIKAVNENGGL